jgi:anti-sigma-K factor RskA
MSLHEQLSDDLSLYALGELEGEERAAVDKHLGECPECRQEVERLRGDLALLALSVSGKKPPLRSRERLMAAVAKEPRQIRLARVQSRSWLRPFEWVFAAAAVILVLLLARQNGDLQRRISDLQVRSAAQKQRAAQAEELLAALNSVDTQHFTLIASKTPPQPEGKAIYQRKTGTLVFLASNMPQLPPLRIYEVWLIPASGAPIPAGLFKPDAHGAATIIKPPLPPGVEAKTFAITIEPEKGSAAPTSQPIMVGAPG